MLVVDKGLRILPSASAMDKHPYLAHLSNNRTGEKFKDGVSGVVHPLHGWTPRKVTAEQVRKAIDGDVNPFTKQPVSATYKKIMETRKKLPVYGYMEEFYRIVSASFTCALLASQCTDSLTV
jgi:pre-mRNA-splicing factor ATP-dependent RNA helicase DHX15/PRP43